MALDWSKDVRSLQESDLSGLTADEKKILGRLCASEPIYITPASDATGTAMAFSGNGSVQHAYVAAGSVVIAALRGWVKV